jgi:hypothetical protein
MVNKLVFRGAEEGMACIQPPASFVDQRLGMLNAKANRKGLGFKRDASLLKHLEAVSG